MAINVSNKLLSTEHQNQLPPYIFKQTSHEDNVHKLNILWLCILLS